MKLEIIFTLFFSRSLYNFTIRKINNFLGLAVPGITIVLASYVENTALAITLFNISLGMTAFAIPGGSH